MNSDFIILLWESNQYERIIWAWECHFLGIKQAPKISFWLPSNEYEKYIFISVFLKFQQDMVKQMSHKNKEKQPNYVLTNQQNTTYKTSPS